MDFDGSPPFVITIIPFDQVTVRFGRGSKSGEFTRSGGALQGAAKDLRKADSPKTFPQKPSVAFASFGQRQIGEARVLAGNAPGRLAMSGEVCLIVRFQANVYETENP